MAKPFIAAYKAGSTSVDDYITNDQIIYWYRPSLKTASCDATDTTAKPANVDTGNYFEGIPNGADEVADSLFVVALLTKAGTVEVTSGSNSKSFDARAGANAFAVDMGIGSQSFSLTRGGEAVLRGTSLKDISGDCICGIYNFNAYVGTLPAGSADSLQSPDGFLGFTSGIAPGICEPSPSLGTAPVATSFPAVSSRPSSLVPTSVYVSAPPQSAPSSTGLQQATSPIASRSVTTPETSKSKTQDPSLTSTPAEATTIGSSSTTSRPEGSTITVLSQLYPTNCLRLGQVWAGSAALDPPAKCDGA